jgi:hypothetical protein
MKTKVRRVGVKAKIRDIARERLITERALRWSS